jgi:hypothetical protein
MVSVIITPRDKKEFNLAFDLLPEFGNGRKPLEWDGKGDIGFIFLLNESDTSKDVTDKMVAKKLSR